MIQHGVGLLAGWLAAPSPYVKQQRPELKLDRPAISRGAVKKDNMALASFTFLRGHACVTMSALGFVSPQNTLEYSRNKPLHSYHGGYTYPFVSCLGLLRRIPRGKQVGSFFFSKAGFAYHGQLRSRSDGRIF